MDSQTRKWVVEATEESFVGDVFQRSQLVPVIVDFWAPWCAPCRILGPTLEALAEEFAGQFVLVKANVDELPGSASQFSVSGIPAVFAIMHEKVVDTFQGALPEPAIREWLGAILRNAELQAAIAKLEDHPEQAELELRALLATDPNRAEVSIALADALLRMGRLDDAKAIIEQLEKRGFLEPEAERLKAQLDLAGKEQLDVDSLRREAAADPESYVKQFALAEALAGRHEYQSAFDICLRLVEKDRHQTGEQARALMVEVFRVLPDDSPLTSDYRRRLSMLLY
ncbi:MAG: tetratricopeptide repeat protein [Planctomycetales bacterium]|nr:tetratricopeptide repeat protein [Planctomycetales bacterium]